MGSILTKIQALRQSIKGADSLLANYLVEHPDQIIYKSVAEVAQESGVSEATVIRFARKLGLTGYQDLKLHLAHEVISPMRSIHEAITTDDTPETLLSKVFGSHIATLNDTLQVVDAKALAKAADAIAKARHVYFVGVGTSGPNTLDAYNKFFRLGVPCSAHTDSHLQAMVVALAGPQDVVVAITHSGNTKDPAATLTLARKAGATTIAITNFSRSPITRIANIVLHTASMETRFRAEAVASRIAQVAIIDTLWTMIALRDQRRTADLQERIEDAVADKQF